MSAHKGNSFDWEAIAERLARSLRDADPESAGPEQRSAQLRERRAALARMPAHAAEEPGADALEVLVFEVAGQRFGIETTCICQAVALPALTPLPGVPAYVAGIAALRGRVVAVLDLRSLLAMSLARLTEPSTLVVLQEAGMEFGLLADAVEGVLRYPRAALSPGAADGPAKRRDYLLGVAPDRTAILDGRRLLGDASLVVHSQND